MGSKLSRWVKRVRETLDDEINCSECLEQVSQYVDLEIATGEAAQRMPQVKHHLDQCQVCAEEYRLLRDLAQMEARGEPPSPEALAAQLKRRAK